MSLFFSMSIDETHHAGTMSWVEAANDPATDFPIQNLPFCCFVRKGDGPTDTLGRRLGVAIGDRVLDLHQCAQAHLFDDVFDDAAGGGISAELAFIDGDCSLIGDGRPGTRSAVRRRLVELLRHDNRSLRDNRPLLAAALFEQKDVAFVPPARFGNYTDFYASIHHAATVGSMFRPDNPLLPNYKWVPIGYHGRASSIVVSGTEVRRPRGQASPPDDRPGDAPPFGPSRMLDYECEVGVVIGEETALGEPVPIGEAEGRVLGVCLVNDWSARDVQKWEYQPLGPFLAKNFATSVSPFVVTMEALEPFRCAAYRRPEGDPRPLPYLWDEENQRSGGIDLMLEVYIISAEMERRGMEPLRVSRSRAFKDLYWTIGQLVAHHTSNGCNLEAGDLLASGTVSGPCGDERGCLLELTWRGRGPDGKPLPRQAIELPTGEKRLFLEDGDEVVMRGWCEREGFRRIGLGECRGRIAAAVGR